MKDTGSTPINPFMTDTFARVYEETGERITGQASSAAIDLVGGIGPGKEILDIGAGTGALTIPAAMSGANVTAIDIAPGMIRRLSVKAAKFPNVDASEMDGTDLSFSDGYFDATFSVFGVITFSDWRKGLREQARVTRQGGKGCVVAWGDPIGGGPFQIVAAAIANILPDRPALPKPEAFVVLSDADRLTFEMEVAGFIDVSVTRIACTWQGPTGQVYLDMLRELHSYMRAYQSLSSEEKILVDAEIINLTQPNTSDGKLELKSPVLIAVGKK